MARLLMNWLVYGVAIGIAAFLLPGVTISGFLTALLLAVVLGAINTFIRPVLIMLTLPLSVVTFGLFVFVINALVILFAAAIVPGFRVDGFWWALLFSAVLSLVSSVIYSFGDDDRVPHRRIS